MVSARARAVAAAKREQDDVADGRFLSTALEQGVQEAATQVEKNPRSGYRTDENVFSARTHAARCGSPAAPGMANQT